MYLIELIETESLRNRRFSDTGFTQQHYFSFSWSTDPLLFFVFRRSDCKLLFLDFLGLLLFWAAAAARLVGFSHYSSLSKNNLIVKSTNHFYVVIALDRGLLWTGRLAQFTAHLFQKSLSALLLENLFEICLYWLLPSLELIEIDSKKWRDLLNNVLYFFGAKLYWFIIARQLNEPLLCQRIVVLRNENIGTSKLVEFTDAFAVIANNEGGGLVWDRHESVRARERINFELLFEL